MHTCTPKYCGVLSSHIVPATYNREKTQRLDICEPETASWCQKETAPSHDHGGEENSVENTEENGCVASSLTNNIF
ncbi:hypothetical protein TNCV_4057231 [Trichonephila clavipes]|nr:hypothetical protein TNCV_4057231 [Trichonephila clavipes]